VERFAGPYQVFAMDIHAPESELPTGAQFVEIDVTSDDRVQEAFEQLRARHDGAIASVIQLAAYYDFSGEPSNLYNEITVQGTRRVLEGARDLSAEQFVFSSTMLVHAPTKPGHPFREDQPLDAKWDYPQSKVATENVIAERRGELATVLLRIAGVYSDACDSLPLSHQIQRIYERRLTASVYPGDVNCGQAFVHIEDLVDAFWRTVEKRGKLPNDLLPILIGEPETPAYGQLQNELGRLLHGEPDWKTRQIPKLAARTGAWIQDKIPGIEEPFIKPWMIDLADDHYELDIARARELLGWSPARRLMDALPKMVESLRADPEAWYERHGLEVPAEVAGHNKP
jgi:nucleoside-diphosphate-sugar epimerase